MQKFVKILLKFDKKLTNQASASGAGRRRSRRATRASWRRRSGDVPGGGEARDYILPRTRAIGPRHHHSFRGSLSAGSTPIFASKYAFCIIFQDLQVNHLLASKVCKLLQIFSEFCKILILYLRNLHSLVKICKIRRLFTES